MDPKKLGQARPGEALAKRPPAGAPAAPPASPPAAPGPAKRESPPPPPQLAKDGNGTSQLARQEADRASTAYQRLLQKADLENRTWDDAFGKFTARQSREDATKKLQEKQGKDDQNQQERAMTSGLDEMGGTGRAFLRTHQKPDELPEEDDQPPVDERPEDLFAPDANGTTERQKVDQMSDERRAAYEHLATHLMEDPQARRALQTLLLDGRLPAGGGPDAEGMDFLAGLEAFAHGEIDPEIDRWKLIADLVTDIANPGALAADEGPPDPVIVVLMLLAAKRPAEYVRLVRTLATPAGTVKLADGRILRRKGRLRPGTSRWSARLLWEALDDEEEYEDWEEKR